MLSPQHIKSIFGDARAIIIGDHFVYAKKETGWFHGYDYVNKDAIYPHTNYVKILCEEIALHFICKDIQVVVGPTIGGVGLSQWIAYKLFPALAVYADEEDVLVDGKKIGTRRVIKRGYDKHVKGKRCLIVEDVINSGATVVKTRDAVLAAGGWVVGVGCLCNRSGGKVTAQTLGVPDLFWLLAVDMKMFPEDECPICKERGLKSVRTDIGKGQEFLTRKGLV